jgi:hypothetical protein
MKKLVIVFALAAICGPAFGDPDTFTVTSRNMFGSYKVAASTEYVMLAAPFEGFEGKTADTACTPGTILARDLVATTSLAQDDSLSIYKANTTDVYDYDNYTLESVTIPGFGDYTYWAKSGWFSGDSMVVYNPPKPEERPVNVGEGFFLGRDKDNSEEYVVYASGQIPEEDVTTVTIPAGAEKMLLCPPGTNALVQVNLNDFSWTGVSAATGRPTGDTANITLTSSADQIYYITPEGTTVRMGYLRGSWYGYNGAVWSKSAAVIPAGCSFWYMKGGSDAVTVKWAEDGAAATGD